MRILLYPAILLLLQLPLYGKFYLSADSAFHEAYKADKNVLMIFSGSDWCASCIRFKKEILSTTRFRHYADENLVVLKIDFPQHQKQPTWLQEQNERLAKTYNPNGNFPHILLLSPDGEPKKELKYHNQSCATFITEIDINTLSTYRHKVRLMGVSFEFVAVDDKDPTQLFKTCTQEIKRIENLISSWQESSQTSEINQNAANHPVQVECELAQLIERSKAISQITQGAFDISYAVLDKYWKFDGRQKSLPDTHQLKSVLPLIDYEHILVSDSCTVTFSQTGMRIGFGGIGKGYAADKAKALLLSQGINNGVINAGGDLIAWGEKANGELWNVGISNPLKADEVALSLSISDKAVVTSGNYEKRTEIDGKYYSHILNPRTGWPVEEIISATVIHTSAEMADALATAITVLGIEVGLDLVNQLPDTEAILISEKGELFTSKNITIQKNEGYIRSHIQQ